MEYTFNNRDDWYYVNLEEENYKIIERFTYYGWTPSKVQEIIDGVEKSKTLSKEEPFEWANEDVELNANENGVWLYDWLADRGGEKDTDKLNLFLTHEETLTFLKDFKKFVEENS